MKNGYVPSFRPLGAGSGIASDALAATLTGGAQAVGGLGAYPHIFPPLGAQEIQRVNQLITPVGVYPQTFVLETIQITQGWTGWLKELGLDLSNWGAGFFFFTNGGAILRDYTHIAQPIGAPETRSKCMITISPNIPLVLNATVNSAALSLRWNLWGWYCELPFVSGDR